MNATLILVAVLLPGLPGCRQERAVTSAEQFLTPVIADLNGVDGLDRSASLCADSAPGRSACDVSKVNAADLPDQLADRLHDRGHDTRVRLQQNHVIWSITVVRSGYGVVVHIDPLDRSNDDSRRVAHVKEGFRSDVGIDAAPANSAEPTSQPGAGHLANRALHWSARHPRLREAGGQAGGPPGFSTG